MHQYSDKPRDPNDIQGHDNMPANSGWFSLNCESPLFSFFGVVLSLVIFICSRRVKRGLPLGMLRISSGATTHHNDSCGSVKQLFFLPSPFSFFAQKTAHFYILTDVNRSVTCVSVTLQRSLPSITSRNQAEIKGASTHSFNVSFQPYS